jgi:hypothetical protein
MQREPKPVKLPALHEASGRGSAHANNRSDYRLTRACGDSLDVPEACTINAAVNCTSGTCGGVVSAWSLTEIPEFFRID